MEIVRVAVNGYGVIGKRVVDAGPKGVGAANLDRHRAAGVKAVLQSGEKHGATGHSLVAHANYVTALGRDAARVVSCSTTAIVRVLGALAEGLLASARGVATSPCGPGESPLGTVMNHDAAGSIRRTHETLGIRREFVPRLAAGT